MTKTKEMEKYTDEDLEIDVNWLIGQGVDDAQAEDFIMNLLKSKYVGDEE